MNRRIFGWVGTTVTVLVVSASSLIACSSSSSSGGGGATDGGGSSTGDSGSGGNDATTTTVTCTDVCNNIQSACAAAFTSDCVSQCQAQNGTSAELSCAASATSCNALQACQSGGGGNQIAYGGTCTCAQLSGGPGHCTNTACANPNGDYGCYNTSSGVDPANLICTEPCDPNNDNCPGNSTCANVGNGGSSGNICIPN